MLQQTKSAKGLDHVISIMIVLGIIVSGCASTPAAIATSTQTTAPTPTVLSFQLTSSAFKNNETIPEVYSCHGDGISPALAWSASPAGTQSFALIMDDPDAVKVVGYVYVHWLIYNIPANVSSLPEKMPRKDKFPDGTLQGANQGYGPPCPPAGLAHGYRFTLYALDIKLDLQSGANKEALLKAMDGHILAQTELIGKYASP
jgi:Raf kinase inhibitor-like YbhB/YbcL family protein